MILGVESSCDETALALYCPEKGVVGEWVHSQVAKHLRHGGVVPDLAVREHLVHFFHLLDLAEKEAGALDRVEKIAVTCGPGLAGCLAIGISLARTLGMIWDLPVVGVNHLRGHAFSPFLPEFESKREISREIFPHLGLLASGGNTLLFQIAEDRSIEILAETMDDAAGEALDKGAKMLGISYPGGAELEKCSEGGDPKAFSFPRAFPEPNQLRFSFSGLKTSLRYTLEKMSEQEIHDSYSNLCASYQMAAVDQLVVKTGHALRARQFASLGLSGGVANNKLLKSRLSSLAESSGMPFFFPESRHTGDNASMIAFAAMVDPGVDDGLPPDALTFFPSIRLDQVIR